MASTELYEEPRERLNRRLEAIGWGLFLVIIGCLWLIPDERIPSGTWLIAAGVIMLGVNAVRYLNAIRMSRGSLLLGFLAVIFGAGALAGIDVPFVPILVIILGASIILRPWLEPLLEPKHQ